MLVSVFSPKGGSGATIASVLVAQVLCDFGHCLVVDANNGDLAAAVGLDEPNKYCFDDWVNSAEPNSESLKKISIDITGDLSCIVGDIGDQVEHHLPSGNNLINQEKIDAITSALSGLDSHCVVDLGTKFDSLNASIAKASDTIVMALRPCYMGLSRAMKHPLMSEIDVCVLVRESGRTLKTQDMVRALKLSRVIELEARRDFARVIDSGLLAHRTPEGMLSPFKKCFEDIIYSQPNSNDVFDDTRLNNQKDFWRPQPKRERRLSKQQILTSSHKYSQHSREILLDNK